MSMQNLRIKTSQASASMMVVLFLTVVMMTPARSQPKADFSADRRTIYVGQGIWFTDKSTNAAQWYWIFEGGNPPTANTKGPHYVQYLMGPGTYSVTLNVRDDTGLGDSKTITITVLEPNLDFGDAPDDQDHHYRTMDASDGARHLVNYQIYLGDTVDVESDGQQSLSSDGDDLNYDDEDGVVLNDTYVWHREAPNEIKVTVFGTGFLNGWVDLNHDGDWDEANEHVIQDEALTSGSHTITVTLTEIPLDYYTVYSHARFRYSTVAGLSYYGYAPDGEVEDYEFEFTGADFGDASEWLAVYYYPTTLDNNGARHRIDNQIYLGNKIDQEFDGQESPDAEGDDLHNHDDEDGVQIGDIYWDSPNDFEVTVVGSGYLNGWIDLNRDTDWNSAVSHVIVDQFLNTGTHTLTLSPATDPQTYSRGDTYARFRFSSVAGLPDYGFAPDGEVEDYLVHFPGCDFGDAPDPYPTLLGDDGARHSVRPGVILGVNRDADAIAYPDLDALGDDNNNVDDEDGVLSFTKGVAGGTNEVTVITNMDGGYLNAWIDFNADGDWDDPEEQIFTNKLLNAGNNDLEFNIPFVPNQPGTYDTFSRLRLSTQQDLNYDGCAPDGEVQDYKNEIRILDFGDAPDPPYSTIKDPSHHLNYPGRPHVWLGDKIDADGWGQPDDSAMGDDLDGTDDDDGVIFTSPIRPGQAAYLTVTANGSGYLSVWIDFDGDGSWTTLPSENIFYGTAISSGSNNLSFIVPGNVTPKKTYARFRFSAFKVAYSNDFDYLSGEVEDYLITIVAGPDTADYGDAPDPLYPTLAASSGAVHTLNPTIYLGSEVDAEPDGQPDENATGDDQADIDDDDGVIFTSSLMPGNTAHVQVTSMQGILNAWVDFNGDGDWNDPGEQIFSGLALPFGIHDLSFNVPTGAALGSTFARFRFSSVAVLGPTGSAPNGEVEDYAVTIREPVYGAVKWSQPPLKRIVDPFSHAYDGWDEPSIYSQVLLSDDWFCADPQPVTAIRWWGSYAEWDTTVPPINAPMSFHIGVWKDVPRGEDQSWSHPGEMVWEWEVARSILNERVVGSDFHAEYMNMSDSCFLYEFYIPSQEWFYQEGDSTVYWLSIAAVYDTIPDEHIWGWKTREHYFNDDAIQIQSPVEPEKDDVFQQGQPLSQGWDMAFELLTTEYEVYYDFGDAPHPEYPTLLSRNGAHHLYWPDMYLGSAIDPETEGIPHPDGMGDDFSGMDDEDGVIFTTDLIPGRSASVEVTAHSAGYLNAWIDFNGDGDWLDPAEQIFLDESLTSGTNMLNFGVPSNIVHQFTFARFRFSGVQGIQSFGIAIGGEVEDYQVTLITGIENMDVGSSIPPTFAFFQNYPNPFNPETTFQYDLPVNAHVLISVYNINGQKVDDLVDHMQNAGSYQITWDAEEFPSGTYVIRMQAGEFVQMRKCVLMK